MQIEIEYGTQVRVASGVSREQLTIDSRATPAALLQQLTDRHSALSAWIEPTGKPRPGLLVFVNDRSLDDVERSQLHDGDQVALLTLVSGG